MTKMSGKIWFIEDDNNLRHILSAVMRDEGHEVREFPYAENALKALQEELPEVILTDFQMPGMNGVEFLREVKNIVPQVPVIILTAYGSVELAVESMKPDAYDFLTKPVSNDHLLIVIRNALELSRANAQLNQQSESRKELLSSIIVGDSKQILKVRELVSRIAEQNTTVLLSGETGTGKEVAARAIHSISSRSSKPFIAVNCSAIPENLVESELFGHKKGAFTGAVSDRKGFFLSADCGTIFLDEIGDLPLNAQAKLLRVLEEQVVTPVGISTEIKIDARVITATNRNLEEMIKNKTFREDLFYRINVFPIHLPSLRERKDDISILATHLMKQKNSDSPEISNAAMQLLLDYDWPGNVRELDNVLERAMVFAEDGIILSEHIEINVRHESAAIGKAFIELPDTGVSLEELEIELIRQALKRTEGNQTHAARLLGITRSALLYRMEKHGLIEK